MNYRHAFHAGNFADVIKHVALVRILDHLRRKDTAFRVIDTHAGAGLYDLTGPEAARTGEWRDGVGRITPAQFRPAIAALLSPYLDLIARWNPGTAITAYPGSPVLAAAMLREQDRLTACESEPGAAAALRQALRRERRASVVEIDGWTALNAYVPPKERRGLVIIDPPFEQPDEFTRLLDGFAAAHRKWPSGIYLLWYPIKQPAEAKLFARHLADLGIPKILRAELTVAPPRPDQRLTACGLLIVNPPWPLHDELAVLLPALATLLARDTGGGSRLDWLSHEAPRDASPRRN